MMDVDSALSAYERAALPPARKLRDEVGRRRQLDVHAQALLQPRKGAQQLISVWLKAQINIDCGITPTLEHGGGTSGQIDPDRTASDASKLAGKRTNALLVNRRTHARPPARSSPPDRQGRCSDCERHDPSPRATRRDDGKAARP